MYHKDSKSFLLFGKQLNQIIAILQMVNDFIQYLKDMVPYDDMLNSFVFGDQQTMPDEVRQIGQRDSMTLMVPYDDMLNSFVFGDQETMPDEVRPIGQRDSMTLEEMMDDLQLKFMDKRKGK